MEPRTRIAVLLAACLAAVAVAILVLYGMKGGAVHAGPPSVLDKVELSPNPTPAPEVSFADAAGKPVALADFKGRAVLLNLWATWCAPCVAELPELARAKEGLPEDKIAVVAVALERTDAEKIGAFLKKHNSSALGVYIDAPLDLMRALKTQSLPYTVLIDAEGRVVATASGPQDWGDPEAVAYLNTLLAP